MQFSQGKKPALSRVSLDIRPLKDERKEYIYMKRFPRLPVRLLFAREIVKNATKNFWNLSSFLAVIY